MAQSLHDRLTSAVNVSGAFDNCFFHTYVLHCLGNNIALPQDLFTFRSIAGNNSLASELQTRFSNLDELSVFANYAKQVKPVSPNFIFEKTLILGFLMREWFATTMNEQIELGASIETDTIAQFKAYLEARSSGLEQDDLISGPQGVLYVANKDFLEICVNENLSDADMKEYWKNTGFQDYCKEIAKANTKLSYVDIIPVIKLLNQSLTIYGRSGETIVDLSGNNAIPKMEAKLNITEGHYYLVKTAKTSALLNEYENSCRNYLDERQQILSLEDNQIEAANAKSSLFLGSICPTGILTDDPFALLLDQIDAINTLKQPSVQPQKVANTVVVIDNTEQLKQISPKHQEFLNVIAVLKEKMKKFQGDPESTKAYDAAKTLYDNLIIVGNDYFTKVPTQDSYHIYKQACDTHIKTAREELDQHRGWAKILINVFAMIITAGIGYLIAAGINLAWKGKFTLLSTDTSLDIDKIEDHVNTKAAPGA